MARTLSSVPAKGNSGKHTIRLCATARVFWGTGSIRAKIYSKRICPSLSPMFSVRLDVKRQSSKGGITAFVTILKHWMRLSLE
jgi:hypothetical protein